jgi:hypothetical protein
MFRTATCLAALAALTAPAALAETKSYDAEAFSSIDARGAIDVVYEHAASPSIVVEQAEGDFSDVYLEFDGDTLIVSRNSVRDRSGWFGNTSIKIKDNRKVIKVNGKRVPYYVVRVAGPDLDGARVAASAKLVATGIQSNDFTGKVSSSGDLELSGTAAKAKLKASSSGDLMASAFTAESLEIQASSSGDVEAVSSGKGRVRIDASSSGDVALRSLDAADFIIDASSSADIELEGACGTIEVEASSSADVDAAKLTCRAATVSVSSSGDVSVHAAESVEAQASSGGDVYITGNPASRDISKSSGGNVDFAS